jgi:hypothetical protein
MTIRSCQILMSILNRCWSLRRQIPILPPSSNQTPSHCHLQIQIPIHYQRLLQKHRLFRSLSPSQSLNQRSRSYQTLSFQSLPM